MTVDKRKSEIVNFFQKIIRIFVINFHTITNIRFVTFVRSGVQVHSQDHSTTSLQTPPHRFPYQIVDFDYWQKFMLFVHSIGYFFGIFGNLNESKKGSGLVNLLVWHWMIF